MKKALLLVCLVSTNLLGQPAELQKSRCHVFIDYQFIWTLEMVEGENDTIIPVVNIVTFAKGQWDFRPEQVHLLADRGREAKIERFAIDTGVAEDPYVVQYLKVLGESFIGMDLEGEFQGFEELSQVYIDLADSRFVLEAIDCFQYETLVGKINQVNFDSPDLRQDYSVLKLGLHGKREALRKHY
jgi:hypothetical protein